MVLLFPQGVPQNYITICLEYIKILADEIIHWLKKNENQYVEKLGSALLICLEITPREAPTIFPREITTELKKIIEVSSDAQKKLNFVEEISKIIVLDKQAKETVSSKRPLALTDTGVNKKAKSEV